MFNTAPNNISDQETDQSCCEIEICEIQTQHPNPTLLGNPSTQAEQLIALVSGTDTTAEDTVIKGSHEVSDVMSGLQALEVTTQPEVLEPLLEQIPGHSQAYQDQAQVQ